MYSASQTAYQMGMVEEIPIESITNPEPIHPDDKETLESVERLAQSIKEKGLLQPIVVVREPSSNRYRVVAGQRRLQACIRLGWHAVPAIVRNPVGTEVEIFREHTGQGTAL